MWWENWSKWQPCDQWQNPCVYWWQITVFGVTVVVVLRCLTWWIHCNLCGIYAKKAVWWELVVACHITYNSPTQEPNTGAQHITLCLKFQGSLCGRTDLLELFWLNNSWFLLEGCWWPLLVSRPPSNFWFRPQGVIQLKSLLRVYLLCQGIELHSICHLPTKEFIG
jgi:hypothetical protein